MNLNNPFTKLKANDLYIVYHVTYSYSKNENTRSVSYRDYDGLEHLTRTATVDNTPILLVANPEAKEKNIYAFESIVYGNNIENGKLLHFDLEEEASSSLDTSQREIRGEVEDTSFYGFPTKLIDVFDGLGNSISVRKALKLLRQLQERCGEKRKIVLDFNLLKAQEQLDEAGIITNSIYNENEVKSILEKLKGLSNSKSAVFNRYITEKVNDEIAQYKKNMKMYKPHFGEEKKTGEMELTKSKPKEQLMLNLDSLYHSLLTDISTVHYLEDLYTCASIIDGENKELTKATPLAEKVQAITNKVSSYDNKDEILDNLKSRINAEIDKTTTSLDNRMHVKESKPEIELILGNSFDIELSVLAETYNEKSKVLTPFYNLKKSLNDVRDNSNKSANDINGMIFSISSKINNVAYEELKNSMQNRYNQIKEKYIGRIDEILSTEKAIKATDYKELESALKKELHPLQQELRKIENKSLNQIISSDSLIAQIQNSIKLVNSRKNPSANSLSKDPISSEVSDILNLLKQNSLEDDRLIINKLLITLIGYKDNLIDTKITDYKEYDKVRNEILRSLSRIQLDINSHIKKEADYDKQNIE